MIYRILFTLLLLVFSFPGWAKVYKISTAEELKALQLVPGDKVVLRKGTWKDQKLVLKGKGTEAQPITLTVEKPGEVFLTGHSSLQLDGTWLVADGLSFKEGYSLKEDVILFTAASENCRLTNSAIVDFDHPDRKVDYKWISLNGIRNRVDHCYVKGKNHQGTTLVVWLANKPNYHRIDHNYFADRPVLGGNGGETIRIGTSNWSMHDSYTTVENNIFSKCDGELEIISNKSGHNTIRNNIFYESSGMLTLRHGNDAEVYGNYFLGNGKQGSGGVRIIGENHKVYNNYFHGLAGTGITAAIALMDGLPNSPLVGYFQVKRAQVVHNTIVNCAEAFSIGIGKNDQRNLPPLDCTIANNLVVVKDKLITFYDQPVNLTISGNLVAGEQLPETIPAGMMFSPLNGQYSKEGIWQLQSNAPTAGDPFSYVFKDITGKDRGNKPDVGAYQLKKEPVTLLQDAIIGPKWMKLPVKRELKIKN